MSELVSNAVLHGEGRIELLVEMTDDVLRVEVIDEGTAQTPGIRDQPEGGVGGWGLRLVEELSVGWGAYEGSTHVWADIALD